MPRPRALARQPREPEPDAPAPALPSPVAAVEPEPAPAPPQRSPARQALADAIQRLKDLEAEVAEAGVAVSEAQEARTAAFVNHRDAEEVLRRARPLEFDPYASSYSPGPRPANEFWGSNHENEEVAARARAAEAPPVSIADAKAALEVAQDAWDSARRLVQHHEDRLKQASDRLTWARMSIGGAIRGVLRSDPALLALAQESRRLATRAEAARRAFSAAVGGDTIQPGSPYYGWGAIADANTSPEAMADWSVSRDWSAAIEALASDPDALLPAT